MKCHNMLSGKISKNISICQLLNILPRVLLSCKNMVKKSFFSFFLIFFSYTSLSEKTVKLRNNLFRYFVFFFYL